MKPLTTSLLVLACSSGSAAPPEAKLPIAKDTTYFTGPLKPDGSIDYEAALNERFGKSLAPDKNAWVPIWQALGPTSQYGKEFSRDFFEQLGIQPPPAKGTHFVGLSTFIKQRHLSIKEEIKFLDDWLDECCKRPWKSSDFPLCAALVEANQKPMALIVEGLKRPGHYMPLGCVHEGKPTRALLEILPFDRYLVARKMGEQFVARAMLRLSEGRFDEAWRDLITCHRLARLVGQNLVAIEVVVGLSLENLASSGDLAYLDKANLTAKQIEECRGELQRLPAFPTIADVYGVGERCFCLDLLQTIRRHGIGAYERLDALSKFPPLPKAARTFKESEDKSLEYLNWAPVFRDANRGYDELVAVLRLKDRAQRLKAIKKCDEDLESLSKRALDTAKIRKLIAAGGKSKADIAKAIWEALESMNFDLIQHSAAHQAANMDDQREQRQRNMRVAFALAAYRADHGRYPAALNDLAPKYLRALPGDLFSGAALKYRRTDKGYVLYSVGRNGRDDNGRSFEDEPYGDDIVIRVPVPKRKATGGSN